MTEAPYPGRRCPNCGAPADGQTAMQGDDTLRPGDPVICIECVGISMATEGLELRPVSEAELRHLMGLPEIRAALRLTWAIWTRNGRRRAGL